MINIIILYWDMGCPIRNENTKISWKTTKEMTERLRKKNLDINCTLFEFGQNFNFEDSIKIDMNLDYYERSKKINLAINHNINKDVEFVAIMDSDLFFIEEQYDDIYNDFIEILSGNDNKFFTYNLLDINEGQRKEIFSNGYFDKKKLIEIKEKLSWRHSWGSGTLGGYFVAPLKYLKKIGGYNENFLTWGGEDDDAHTRLKELCKWHPKMWKGPFHLHHPKNENDKKYYIKVYSEEYFQINKVEKPR